MANRPEKKTGKPAAEEAAAPDGARSRSREAPQDQKGGRTGVSANKGFEESPQAEFEGAPLAGPVSDWARLIEEEAEKSARDAEMRDIRSKAGKHRRKAQRTAGEGSPTSVAEQAEGASARTDGEADVPPERKRKTKGADAPPAKRSVYEKRTGGGSLIGGTNDPRARAASGLMPVAGLDVTLEEAKDWPRRAG